MTGKKFRLTAFLLAVLFLLALAPEDTVKLLPAARAVTQSDIDALKGDKKDLDKEKKEIEDELSRLRNNKKKAVERVNALNQKIANTEKQITNMEQQIDGYEALLAQTAYELEENEREEAEQYALFCERARVMEESGTTSYWSVLFKAESFSDLLSRLADVQEVMNYDQNVLDSLRRLRKEIEEKQTYQEQLKEDAELAKEELEVEKAELTAQRKEANDLVAELQADLETAEQLYKQKEEEEAKIEQEIKRKEKELEEQIERERKRLEEERRKAAEAAQQQQSSQPQLPSTAATTGGYIWPVSSKKITSPMGSRNTGIPGASTNHKGVDIGGVGYTTTVVATKAGTVLTAEKSSSYGNYVVIWHGSGNTTLYAHMSSLSVKEGDQVSQGQAIGVTGASGIANGAHLHYEITEGGVRVNPLNYLPGYIQSW